jgi:hypothetical protein
MKFFTSIASALLLALSGAPAPLSARELPAAHASGSANPILPGYFADPSFVTYQDTHYIYATLDPWGDRTLGCWSSPDLANWTFRELNWPTKAACTSPTSRDAAVWAPSVVRGPDGRFFMYVSVGNEVWAGVADHPLGPWRDALDGRPLIPGNFRPGFHMIDAEAFLDDDGTPYLYWGSGWNWTNGRCFAVQLAPDMTTFVGEVRDVTPANYFEAPFMVKRGGRYFLTYSQGKTIEDTYRVHYAVGDSPFGPFTEAANSPVLVTDHALGVVSPGHHAILAHAGRDYILYHRHSVPFDPKFIGRQTCLDELRFTAAGLIEKVTPTHAGPAFLHGLRNRQRLPATASGPAAAVLDDNYATLWSAPAPAAGAEVCLRIDLGTARETTRQELRLEYPWKPYHFIVESSLDGETWSPLHEVNASRPVGSPLVLETPARARFFQLRFPHDARAAAPAVFEWSVF